MTSQLYVDQVTFVSPLTALLFGGRAELVEGPTNNERPSFANRGTGLGRLAARMYEEERFGGGGGQSQSRQQLLPKGDIGMVQVRESYTLCCYSSIELNSASRNIHIETSSH